MGRYVRVLLASAALLGVAMLAACTADRLPGTTPSQSTGQTHASPAGELQDLTVLAVYQPVCGPQKPAPDTSCPPEPVVGVVVTAAAPDGSILAQATTDEAGRAVVRVPAGAITLSASAAPPPRITPRPVHVSVGRRTPPPDVTLLYESSMQ
jgi:hypothetical protein